MKSSKPQTRTGATAPAATEHLSQGQKQALEASDEIEHTHGQQREKKTREMDRLGGGESSSGDQGKSTPE